MKTGLFALLLITQYISAQSLNGRYEGLAVENSADEVFGKYY